MSTITSILIHAIKRKWSVNSLKALYNYMWLFCQKGSSISSLFDPSVSRGAPELLITKYYSHDWKYLIILSHYSTGSDTHMSTRYT